MKKFRREMHGMSNSPGVRKTYWIWKAMRHRCSPTRADGSPRRLQRKGSYVERGITVCDEWARSFTAFLSDMGVRPDGMSLDRIDNSKGYSKENCRWATPLEQMENTRAVMLVTHAGESMSCSAWARKIGVHQSTISKRISSGMTPSEAVAELIRLRKKL